MNNALDLRQLLNIIRQHILILMIMTILGAAAGYSVARFMITPTYSVATSMLVNRSTDNNTQTAGNLYDQQADVQVINTYKNLVISSNVMSEVSEKLKRPKTSSETKYNLSVEKLKNMVTVSNEQSSQVFSINVTGSDPKEIPLIANTVADTFKSKIGGFMKINNVSIIDFAKQPGKPIGPNKKLFTFVGVVISIFMTSLFLLIKEISDTAVKSSDEAGQILDMTNLGEIGYIKPVNHLKLLSKKTEEQNLKQLRSRTSRWGNN